MSAAPPPRMRERRRASIMLSYLEQIAKGETEDQKKVEKKEEKKAEIEKKTLEEKKEIDRNVLSLSGYGSGLSDSDLKEQIAAVTFTLRSLTLDGCTSLTDDLFTKLPDSIWRLSFEANKKITDTGLGNYLIKSTVIRDLSIKSCNITGECFSIVKKKNIKQLPFIKFELSASKFSDEGLEALVSLTSNTLNVIGFEDCQKLTDKGGVVLAQCSNLEEIVLKDCGNITDKTLQAISKGCKKATNLWLLDNPQLTDTGVISLAEELKFVQTFVIGPSKITDTALSAIAKNWSNTLIELVVVETHGITDKGLLMLSQCKKIQRLRLDACSKITEGGLQKLLLDLPLITNLYCSECGLKPTFFDWVRKNKSSLKVEMEGVVEEEEEED